MRDRIVRFACIAFVLAFACVGSAPAQSRGVLGLWRAPDGSALEVHRCGDEICAEIAFLGPAARSAFDMNNPDPSQRLRPLCGLQVGWGFHLVDADHATGGIVYDPREGASYHATLTSHGNILELQRDSWWKIFSSTQQWTRVNYPLPPCHL